MGWGDKWDIIPPPNKPYSQVLREHNEAAEASMRQHQLCVYIGMDQGDTHDTARLVIDGKLTTWFDQAEFEVPVNAGWKFIKVKGFKILDLLVILSGDPEEHCIVHIPTLTWFDNAIPEGEWTIEQLCLWAWKVQQKYQDHWWSYLARFTNETYKDISKDYLDNLKTYCLSVKP